MPLRARDVVVSPPFTLPQTATVEEVARAMVDRAIGCIPIVDLAGKLVGIVTEGDFTAKEDLGGWWERKAFSQRSAWLR